MKRPECNAHTSCDVLRPIPVPQTHGYHPEVPPKTPPISHLKRNKKSHKACKLIGNLALRICCCLIFADNFLSLLLFSETYTTLNLNLFLDPLKLSQLIHLPPTSRPPKQILNHFTDPVQTQLPEFRKVTFMVPILSSIPNPPPLHPRNPMTRPTPLLSHSSSHTGRQRIKRQSQLQQRIQQNTERPGVDFAPIVGLAHDYFGRGVVVAAAAGGEFFAGCDLARETEIGYCDYGVRVGCPIKICGFGELGGGEIDQDIFRCISTVRGVEGMR